MNHATRTVAFSGILLGLALAGPASFGQSPPVPPAAPVGGPTPAAEAAPASATQAAPAPNTLTPAAAAATPAPSASPSPAATPKPEPTPPHQAVDALSDTETQQALELLRSNYVNPAALSEDKLNRATLQGLLERLGGGVAIRQSVLPAEPASPFRAEILDDRIGYIRAGSLDKEHLADFDAALGNFATKKLGSLILDLRATPPGSDFELTAEFIKRLTPKGKMLFAVHRPSAKQERMFTSNQDPVFRGVLVTVVDHETAGAAEVVAAVLRVLDNALVIGETTAGEAAEFSELPLRGSKMLRVAVAEIKLPQDLNIFPDGLKPDVAVEVSAADKAELLRLGLEKGVSGLVFETERVRFNEAALVAGVNPDEIDAEALQNGGSGARTNLSDAALQRAVDLITTVQIFNAKPAK